MEDTTATEAAASLHPRYMNGHDLENPQWQLQVEARVRRMRFGLLFQEHGGGRGYIDSTPGLEEDSGAEDTESSGSSSSAVRTNEIALYTSVECNEMTPSEARDLLKADSQQLPVSGTSAAARAFCKNVPADRLPNIYGITGGVIPMYKYRLLCRAGTVNKYTLFCRHVQRSPRPLTVELLTWMLRLANKNKITSERATTVAKELWTLLEQDELFAHANGCAEQLLIPLDKAWRRMLVSMRESCFGVTAEGKPCAPDSKKLEEVRLFTMNMISLLTHPESVRYFGGQCFARLARYWPESWLMGVRIMPRYADGGITRAKSDMQTLEQLLCSCPMAFCYERTRPAIYSHEHRYSGASERRCVGYAPCLTLQQLVQVCIDYTLPFPATRELFAVQVLALMRQLHLRSFHICVTFGMVLQAVNTWNVSPDRRAVNMCVPSPPLWDGNSEPYPVNSKTPFMAQRSGRTSAPIAEKWLNDDKRARVLRALALLGGPMGGASIHCHHPQVTLDELLKRMDSGQLPGAIASDMVLYTREAFDMEGMLLHAVHRLCRQAEMLARAHGPMKLKLLPANAMYCSEQLAFLRYATGYDPSGAHTVPCEAFANLQAWGGAGKTAAIPLVCQVMQHPSRVLVVAPQGSQINVVNRRYPCVRVATLLRMLYRHEFICKNGAVMRCQQSHKSGGGGGGGGGGGVDEEMRVSPATAARLAETRENRLAALQAALDEWNRRSQGKRKRDISDVSQCPSEPEAYNYGFPFQVCSLEDLEVMIFEEIGTGMWEAITLMLSVLVECAPRLRCVIMMGDQYQLFPISPGHIQCSFLEGFGGLAKATADQPVTTTNAPTGMQFEHSHRTGEGILHQLARSARSGDDSTLYFDNEVAQFVECSHEQCIVPEIKRVVEKYKLTTYDSQLITRTNKWRERLNDELRTSFYPWFNHGGGGTPGAGRNARALAAREKFVYKLNRPSLGMCNNGLYLMCFLAYVQIDLVFEVDHPTNPHTVTPPAVSGAQEAQAWAIEQAERAARVIETELVPGRAALAADLPAEELAAVLYGEGEFSSLESMVPEELASELIPSTKPGASGRNLCLPASCFAKQPYMPARMQGVHRLPMAPSAVEMILRAQNANFLTMRNVQYEVILHSIQGDCVMNSSNAARFRNQSLAPVMVCREYYDGMDPDAPVDQSRLLFVPYIAKERRLFQPAVAVTGHCMQGNQSRCVMFVLPFLQPFDTNNYMYMVFTRAMNPEGNSSRLAPDGTRAPSIVVFGRMEELRRAIREYREPERMSHTGRLLRRVRNATHGALSQMDYTAAAALEVQENGKYGVRTKTFVQALSEQPPRAIGGPPPPAPRLAPVYHPVTADDDDEDDMLLDSELISLHMAATLSKSASSCSSSMDLEFPVQPAVVDAEPNEDEQRQDTKRARTYEIDLSALDRAEEAHVRFPPITERPLIEQ